MAGRIFVPHPYQTMIRDHILDVPRCAIWAGMGLGKSVSTLNALDAIALVDDAPVLVLAPLRVARSTWPEEAAKWSHLSNTNVMPKESICLVEDKSNTTASLATSTASSMPSRSVSTELATRSPFGLKIGRAHV